MERCIEYAQMTDKELAEEINSYGYWDAEMVKELCYRAGLKDEYTNSEDIEPVVYKAAQILNVELD